jgi:SAM-dependent methyltransferase
MKLLNLGCGHKYVKDAHWINADMDPASADVQQCNFLNGIPFPDNQFDLVYHSHVLEHFQKNDGAAFIRECYRICKPGGMIRIAMPNLEVIAQEYLAALSKAAGGDAQAAADYDWMLLEMYDQTVRNNSGGAMLEYLTQPQLPNPDFVFRRIGGGGRKWREQFLQKASGEITKPSKLALALKHPARAWDKIYDAFLRIILGKKRFQYYQTGKFRNGGEIHQWMYDRFSLERLLTAVGFTQVKVQTAQSSYHADWAAYQLDDPEENASIFIEAIKP